MRRRKTERQTRPIFRCNLFFPRCPKIFFAPGLDTRAPPQLSSSALFRGALRPYQGCVAARRESRSFNLSLPGSSAVEQVAVNHLVAGSNPARAANFAGAHASWQPTSFFGRQKVNKKSPILHTYILQKPAARLYIGHTADPDRRLAWHAVAIEGRQPLAKVRICHPFPSGANGFKTLTSWFRRQITFDSPSPTLYWTFPRSNLGRKAAKRLPKYQR